jgi:hypothetical protein
MIRGVGRDAAYIADHLDARSRQSMPVAVTRAAVG